MNIMAVEIIIRLRFSSVGPPVPRVEDQHVHPFPRIPSLDGIELENSPDVLSDYVHQVGRAIQKNAYSIVLQIIRISAR